MKTLPFSLCTGIALLGSFACGTSSNGGPGHSNITPQGGNSAAPSVTGGSGNTGPVFVTGGSGSGLSITDPGNSGSSGGASSCTPGNTTTISGVVMDPGNKNPLYNISVYVADPTSPLPDLETVPVSCGCKQLLPEKVLAIGAPTDASGHFEIPCAPSGNVTLVVQTGKWRRKYENVNIVPNQMNVIPNLRLPANSSEGSLPHIAISTGASDSFECLPLRIGVSASEYVAGAAAGGHIHIYTGYNGATPPSGTVNSPQGLWDSQEHLNRHDVVVLSCEGTETRADAAGTARIGMAPQQLMMNYANAGGRVFASHYQYAWFNTGPFAQGANNLANWMPGMGTVDDMTSFPAEINTTLSTGAAFPEGSALQTWLGLVGALTNNQLPVRFVRNNVKALLQPPSTEWIHLAASVKQAPSAPQYFSADTPVGAAADKVCGRVVYSALHVSGGPGQSVSGVASEADYPASTATGTGGAGGIGTGTGGRGGGTGMPAGGGAGIPPGMGFPGQARAGTVPSGCSMHKLTPQEAALEFMFFDLSSCLVPIGEEPPTIPK
ncbi:MAG TPA: hypothetical protein VFK05_09450 [Polyangiaceae bacterium]|nr:hypothetical protein [Polyangiaceae bacterium]